jgi:hypothetical protein
MLRRGVLFCSWNRMELMTKSVDIQSLYTVQCSHSRLCNNIILTGFTLPHFPSDMCNSTKSWNGHYHFGARPVWFLCRLLNRAELACCTVQGRLQRYLAMLLTTPKCEILSLFPPSTVGTACIPISTKVFWMMLLRGCPTWLRLTYLE